MTFKTALSNLAALDVPGVVNNYTIDTVPDDLSRAQLPALLVLPSDLPQPNDVEVEPGAGFEAIAFAEGTRTVIYTVTHLLLVAPVRAGVGVRSHLPTLIDIVDAYFATLGNDVTLGGTLTEPVRVTVALRATQHGETLYHGCAFRHQWIMEV